MASTRMGGDSQETRQVPLSHTSCPASRAAAQRRERPGYQIYLVGAVLGFAAVA